MAKLSKEAQSIVDAFRLILSLSEDGCNLDVLQEVKDEFESDRKAALVAYDEAWSEQNDAENEEDEEIYSESDLTKLEELTDYWDDAKCYWVNAIDFVDNVM